MNRFKKTITLTTVLLFLNTSIYGAESAPATAVRESTAAAAILETFLGNNNSNNTDQNCKTAVDNLIKPSENLGTLCSSVKEITTPSTSSNRTSNTSRSPSNLSCKQRVDKCRDAISAASGMGPSTKEDEEDQESQSNVDKAVKLYEGIMQVRSVLRNGQSGERSQNNNENEAKEIPNCFSSKRIKDLKELQRDSKAEIEKLEKKMEDIQKEIEKEQKKLAEDDAKNRKEIETTSQELKKIKASADKSIREKSKEAAENTIAVAKKLRQLRQEITKKQSELRAAQFKYNDDLLSNSVEKINLKCNKTLQFAQMCMEKSARKNAPRDEACKDYPTLQTKGRKATAELKEQLQVVNTMCFEELNKAVKNSKFAYDEQVKAINETITDLNHQIQDEENQMNLARQDLNNIINESNREKTEAEQNLNEMTLRLQQDTQNQMGLFNQFVASSTQKMEELKAKITKLQIEQRLGEESPFAEYDITSAKLKSSLDVAKRMCGCSSTQASQSAARTTGQNPEAFSNSARPDNSNFCATIQEYENGFIKATGTVVNQPAKTNTPPAGNSNNGKTSD